MQDIELFFFDVDGTLLDNATHTIPSSTLCALEQLQRQGKKIVVSSGRSYSGVLKMSELARIQWDGYILLNGAVTADASGRELSRSYFSADTCQQLMKIAQEKDKVLYFLGKEEWLNRPADKYAQAAFSFFHRNPNEFDVHPLKESDQVTMALAFEAANSSYSDFQNIQALNVLPTAFCYADLCDRRVNKATGMHQFCQYYGITMENTMSFGDGINDLEMIQAAKIGVAMGQGREEIKAVADYITLPVDQDGLALALRHFDLIP